MQEISILLNKLKKEDGAFNFLGRIMVIIMVVLIAMIVEQIIRRLLDSKLFNKPIKGSSKVKTLKSIINSFVSILIYGLALLFILGFLGIDTTSLVALAGVGGVAIAFAAQFIVKDVIAGGFILFEDQYNIGDWVSIGALSGTVVDITLRVVKLQDVAGEIHIIPNGSVTTVTNHSKNDMKAIVEIPISRSIPFEKARKLIQSALDKMEDPDQLKDGQAEIIGITSLQQWGYTVRVSCMAKAANRLALERLIRQSLLTELQEYEMNHLLG